MCMCLCVLKEEFQGSVILELKSVLEVVEHRFEAVKK